MSRNSGYWVSLNTPVMEAGVANDVSSAGELAALMPQHEDKKRGPHKKSSRSGIIETMPTFYRPTQYKRGKGVVFRSIDPAEPQRQMRGNLIWIIAMLLWIGFMILVAKISN